MAVCSLLGLGLNSRYMIGDVPSVGNVSDFEDFSLALINMPAKVTDIDVWAMQLLEVLHPLPLFSKSTKLIAFSPLSVMMTKTRLKEEDIWSHISDTFFELNQNEIDSIVIIDTSPPKYFQETCEKLESCFDSLGCQVQLTSLHQSVEEYYRENKIIPILEHENLLKSRQDLGKVGVIDRSGKIVLLTSLEKSNVLQYWNNIPQVDTGILTKFQYLESNVDVMIIGVTYLNNLYGGEETLIGDILNCTGKHYVISNIRRSPMFSFSVSMSVNELCLPTHPPPPLNLGL
eukprot:TRINITY_DN4122_c0_g1_i13.p1 TRINITY_DN4122_c0_g1~~TRINITY_DN4122_c0_g1_i13.p1  ORF type:complete len:288 (-),score=41.04 TRINITY_DN4122_c0_g1_i13:323-1186(-)